MNSVTDVLRKSDGEKIDELEISVARLREIVAQLRRSADGMADHPTRIALLESEVAELRNRQENWGQCLWMILAPLVGFVVGSLLTCVLMR